jgi:hypothetical protein
MSPERTHDVEAMRLELSRAVAKVYVAPDRVMRDLEGRVARAEQRGSMQTRDAESLAPLQGRERPLLGPDQARRDAVAALPTVPVALERFATAHRELTQLEERFKAFQSERGAPSVGAGWTSGVSAVRSGISLGKGLVESPDQAALTAAMVAANAVSPAAGRIAGIVAGAMQSGSAESAFITATTSLGKMALTKSVAMLPPALSAPALVGIRVLGRILDVTGPER